MKNLENISNILIDTVRFLVHIIHIKDAPKAVFVDFEYTSSEHTKKMSPAGIYLLKVINRNSRTRCEICSKITIKIPE